MSAPWGYQRIVLTELFTRCLPLGVFKEQFWLSYLLDVSIPCMFVSWSSRSFRISLTQACFISKVRACDNQTTNKLSAKQLLASPVCARTRKLVHAQLPISMEHMSVIANAIAVTPSSFFQTSTHLQRVDLPFLVVLHLKSSRLTLDILRQRKLRHLWGKKRKRTWKGQPKEEHQNQTF